MLKKIKIFFLKREIARLKHSCRELERCAITAAFMGKEGWTVEAKKLYRQTEEKLHARKAQLEGMGK